MPRRRPAVEYLGNLPALTSHPPRGVRRLAWAMPERIGVAAAGAGVGCSRHDKARSPERHNTALCLIAGPEHLEGEVSRYVLRLRHRERQINITSSCACRGKQGQLPRRAACEHRSSWPVAHAIRRTKPSLVLRGSVGYVAPVCESELAAWIPIGRRPPAQRFGATWALRFQRQSAQLAFGIRVRQTRCEASCAVCRVGCLKIVRRGAKHAPKFVLTLRRQGGGPGGRPPGRHGGGADAGAQPGGEGSD